MKTKTIMLAALITFSAGALAFAGEPAWWTQQKVTCGLPASTAYNDWAAQGSPCRSAGASAPVSSGSQIGTTLGQAFVSSFQQGYQQGLAIQQQRRQQMTDDQRALDAQEAQRLAVEANNDARQNELASQHLQGALKFSDSSTDAATPAKAADAITWGNNLK
jgi:hypothetical protein